MQWLKRLFGFGSRDGDPAGPSGGMPDMATCEEALERLYELLDGELGGVQQERVAKHFEICQQCYPSLVFERSFLDVIHGVEQGQKAPDALRQKVLEALREAGLEAE